MEHSGAAHRGYCRPTDRHFTVTGNTGSVGIFAKHFLFVTEILRWMFGLCSFQCCLRNPFFVSPKAVSSNRTTWFTKSFFTSFWTSAVRPNRCSSYSVYFVLIDSPLFGCLKIILF